MRNKFITAVVLFLVMVCLQTAYSSVQQGDSAKKKIDTVKKGFDIAKNNINKVKGSDNPWETHIPDTSRYSVGFCLFAGVGAIVMSSYRFFFTEVLQNWGVDMFFDSGQKWNLSLDVTYSNFKAIDAMIYIKYYLNNYTNRFRVSLSLPIILISTLGFSLSYYLIKENDRIAMEWLNYYRYSNFSVAERGDHYLIDKVYSFLNFKIKL